MASVTMTVRGDGIGEVAVTSTFSEADGIAILSAYGTRYAEEKDEVGNPVPKTAAWIVDKMCKTVVHDILEFTLTVQKRQAAEAAMATVQPIAVQIA